MMDTEKEMRKKVMKILSDAGLDGQAYVYSYPRLASDIAYQLCVQGLSADRVTDGLILEITDMVVIELKKMDLSVQIGQKIYPIIEDQFFERKLKCAPGG
jgi:hypothetical protein